MPTIAATFTVEQPSVVTLLSIFDVTTNTSVPLPSPATFAYANGQWSISFNEPAGRTGDSYSFTFQPTWADGSAGPIIPGDIKAISVAGYYGALSDIDAEMGAANEAYAADPDASGSSSQMNAYRVQAMTLADTYINTRLFACGYKWPATTSLAMLKLIFAKLGAWQLYQIRGMRDRALVPVFESKRKWAEDQLEDLILCNRGAFSTINRSAPQAIAPTVDPRGFPIAGDPPYPAVSWDGYRYIYGV